MSHYENNLEFIRTRGFNVNLKPGLGGDGQSDVLFTPSRTGGLTFTVIKENRKITYHSPYDPYQEAVKMAEKHEFPEIPDIVLIYGLGMGYHVSAVRNRLGPETKIIVVEPDTALLEEILHHIDLPEILDVNTVLVSTGNVTGPMEQVKGLFSIVERNRVVFIEHPVYAREYPQYFTELTKKIKDYISGQVTNVATIVTFNEKWLINNLSNLPFTHNSPGVKNLDKLFTDFPAILVSAGPSLDKNIHLLKEAKNRAVIIAVGTALRSLLKKGISPDFIITVDAGVANFRHFEGLDYSHIPLVFEPMVYPGIVSGHHGKKFVYSTGHRFHTWIEKYIGSKGYLPPGGSVATSGFGLAHMIGANPIIMIGQDLAFTDNKTHTADSVYGERKARINTERSIYYMEVDAYDGGKIWTSRSLLGFLKWFENAISTYKNRTVINATEGGARIKGAVQMTLHEALEQYCTEEKDVQKMIAVAYEDYDQPDTAQVIGVLKDAVKSLDKMAKVCKAGEAEGDKLLRLLQKGNADNLAPSLKRLKKVDNVLKKEQDVLSFLDEALQRASMSVLRQNKLMEQNQNEDWKMVAEMSKKLYGAIGPTCRRFSEFFQDAIKTMQEVVEK